MKKKFEGLLVLLCFTTLLVLSGCGSSSSDDHRTEGGTISGTVIDFSTGDFVNNANIVIGSKTATTNTIGEFTITSVEFASHIPVNVTADGFTNGSQITILSQSVQTANIIIKLVPITYTGSFDPQAAQNITVAGTPARVELDADSLVKQGTSSAPQGDVTVDITIIDPTADPSIMPGDFSAINTAGETDIIESFGAIEISFKDESGDVLNLAAGASAKIRIPVAKQTEGVAPATIPLYYYSSDLGKWIEEGSATLSDDGTYYEGIVTHFTYWNADIPIETVYVSGCVSDVAGLPIPYATIELQGKNYIGESSATANSAGEFTIPAKKNAIAIINAINEGMPSNTIEIVVLDEDIQLDNCLLIAAAAVKIKLTWGENPSDLDSHFFLPDGTHFYYAEEGDITVTPFIGLDVDDTDSFGPEVFTVLEFISSGTYRYAVNLYSGSGTIKDSPARVELTIGGATRLFVPPAGTPDVVWNVFNLVVDDAGNITVVPVNTWGSVALGKKGTKTKK